jgi:5-methylcytosine-specific restriction endonuclease McrA
MSGEELAKAKKKYAAQSRSKLQTQKRVRQWHIDNAIRVTEIKKTYAESEKGIISRKRSSQSRIARMRQLKVPFNDKYWVWLCNRLEYKCQLCFKTFEFSQLTVDHWIPISKGGDNDEWNIQPACKSCNSKKQDKIQVFDNISLYFALDDWMEIQGKVGHKLS